MKPTKPQKTTIDQIGQDNPPSKQRESIRKALEHMRREPKFSDDEIMMVFGALITLFCVGMVSLWCWLGL